VGGFRGDGTNPTGELLNKHTQAMSVSVASCALTSAKVQPLLIALFLNGAVPVGMTTSNEHCGKANASSLPVSDNASARSFH
jgi:hypothetical protein